MVRAILNKVKYKNVPKGSSSESTINPVLDCFGNSKGAFVYKNIFDDTKRK